MIWTMKTWGALGLAAATAVVFAGAVVVAYRTGYASGTQEVTAKWNAEKAALAAAQAEELMKARQRERALTEALEQQRLERRREVDRILRDHRAAIERLRDRPERPSGGGVSNPAPAGAGAAAGCTGAGLFRSDGEFLVGEAARADLLRTALRQCQAAYDQVRESLRGRHQD